MKGLASYPGNMKINVFHWIKNNFISVLKRTIILIISLTLLIKVHWTFVFMFIAILLYIIWHWYIAFNLFKGGDINPGKVISINPDRIAVTTNMTKMGGDFPILRIFGTKLNKKNKIVGQIIPTIALYTDNPFGLPFWIEFNPRLISDGISDKEKINQISNTFSQEDLKRIDYCLNSLQETTIGTYKVDEDNNNWKDYKDVIIGSLRKIKDPKINKKDRGQ